MPKAKAKVVKAPKLPDIRMAQLNDKHVVLKLLAGREDSIARRVVHCTGGFGCNPALFGTAVFGTEVVNGNCERWDRSSFERIATPSEIKEAETFFKMHSFKPVCRKNERGMKLLTAYKQDRTSARLLKHKKTGQYHLKVYSLADDKWTLQAETVSVDSIDPILLEFNTWLPS